MHIMALHTVEMRIFHYSDLYPFVWNKNKHSPSAAHKVSSDRNHNSSVIAEQIHGQFISPDSDFVQ